MADFNETLKYRVELDTQGLQAQLASVRDVVGRGIQGVAGDVAGGASIARGATNQIVADLSMGGSIMASAAAQMGAPMAPVGMSGTFLNNQPGMPRSFFGELTTAFGVQTPPVGVFGQQAQFVARERMRERVQGGLGAVASLGAGMAGWQLGAAAGSIFGPAGTLIGGIAGGVLGDVAMQPLINNMQERQATRANLMDTFGFNFLSHQQRMNLSDSISMQSARSLFSSEEFSHITPGAAQAGFFRGIERGAGADAAIQNRLNAAEQFTTRQMYALGLSGPEGIARTLELSGQMRRLGINNSTVGGVAEQERIGRMSNLLALQTREATGEVISGADFMQVQAFVGQQAQAMGLTPQNAMAAFRDQTATLNEAIMRGRVGDDTIAMLGGSPVEAAQRMTFALAGAARHPVMRAMTFAAAAAGPGGRMSVDPTTVSQMRGAGAFELAQGRLMDMTAGREGTNRMFSMMANQNRLQSEMMQNNGEMLMGITDEVLRQGNIDINSDNRRLVMQRMFGIGEAESEALVKGEGLQSVARAKMAEGDSKLQRDISGAIKDKTDSLIHSVSSGLSQLRSELGGKLDRWTDMAANKVVPPLEGADDKLGEIQRILSNRNFMTSNSPISVGPINFRQHDPMVAANPYANVVGGANVAASAPGSPMDSQIFNAAEKSLMMIPGSVQRKQIQPSASPLFSRSVFGGHSEAGG